MNRLFHLAALRRVLPVAALLAVCFALLLPATASAHAILLHSMPDSTISRLSDATISGQGVLDGPLFFNLIMITLVELGAVFWVGAQFWQLFVLLPATEDAAGPDTINRRVQQRFDRYFSPITLLVLLIANIGVLVGQALTITGESGSSLDAGQIAKLATSGRFGTFWTMRELVVFLALVVAIYMLLSRQRPQLVNKLLPWLNLVLGLTLFIAIAMSSLAAVVSGNLITLAIPIDWLHLVAAALWVGGMMYIGTSFLPILRRLPMPERARSLVTVLPYYTPWAVAGIVIMAVTGPFSATLQMNSWGQLFTTAYGRTLIIKIVLIAGLLLTTAIHIFLLRPRLKRETKKYAYAVQRLEARQMVAAPKPVTTKTVNTEDEAKDSSTTIETDAATRAITQQVKLREERLTQVTRTMTRILSWEPVLGVAILVCVGLMNVFAGTLAPTATTQQPINKKPASFNATAKTTDNKFTVKLNVNPNTFGTNVFTATVIDNSTGQLTTKVSVSLFTTMQDMNMGTDTIILQPDGKGHFSAPGDLSMAGNWEIQIQIRTPNNTRHEANVKLFTPF